MIRGIEQFGHLEAMQNSDLTMNIESWLCNYSFIEPCQLQSVAIVPKLFTNDTGLSALTVLFIET